MIPNCLTNAEVGALLKAVGQQMFYRDLCFSAALEDGHSHAAIVNEMIPDLEMLGHEAHPRQRARELLKLTGEEIINFVEGFTND